MSYLPKIIALIPSYNHGRYLRQRIESVLQQRYRNVELIVIDDCSDDNSDEVIKSLLQQHEFQYIRNERNSGTPFAAWERVASLATADYVWICESDDYADPRFLETAVDKIRQTPDAVLFYCNSWIVDENGKKIDHTASYFHDIWHETRWDRDFTSDGMAELIDFQSRGQTVPNMSSALISAKAFQHAYDPFLKSFKLTGDWLFIGWVMRQGKVIFSKETLNCFRKHEVTSRVRVKSARSQAEFLLMKYLLFRETGKPIAEFAHAMRSDAIRFLYEPARLGDVLKALASISLTKSLGFGCCLVASLALNGRFIWKFYHRYQSVKERK